MKLFSTLLGGCAKVLPLVGIVTAIASIGFSIHEAKAKKAYREAKLRIISGNAVAADVVDAVDETDVLNEE